MSAKTSQLTTILTLGVTAALTLMVACGPVGDDPEQDDQLLPQTYAVSECGGFAANAPAKNSSGDFKVNATYCDAEVLNWSYEPKQGTLKLSNDRVLLNCCGDHKITVNEVQGVYVISETDAPEAATGSRCHCMCVFDLAVEVLKIPGGVVQVELQRTVTDDSKGTQKVFSGKLDLSKGQGTLVVDKTDAGMWCEK